MRAGHSVLHGFQRKSYIRQICMYSSIVPLTMSKRNTYFRFATASKELRVTDVLLAKNFDIHFFQIQKWLKQKSTTLIIRQFPNTVSHFHLHGIINFVHQSEFDFWGYKNTMGMGYEILYQKKVLKVKMINVSSHLCLWEDVSTIQKGNFKKLLIVITCLQLNQSWKT